MNLEAVSSKRVIQLGNKQNKHKCVRMEKGVVHVEDKEDVDLGRR